MEIHIGDRIADVTLVSKEGNKVQFLIDGKPYDVDIVMAENGSCSILHLSLIHISEPTRPY